MKNKVLTTTGFYGTGSSAITDLMREYQNVFCQSDYEVRFLYDPDGISDLEYNLIENPNRHNTGHAVKRFKKQMAMLDRVWFFKRYSKYFNGEFQKAINEFCEKIIVSSYSSAWHYDVYERGKLFYVFSRIYSNLNLRLHNLLGIPLNGRGLVPKNEKSYLTIIDENIFLSAVRSLTSKLTYLKNIDNKEFVFFDQLVPPSNIRRYSRYFDDIKIVIMDRDPRDIYLLEKELWRGTIVPTDNIEVFCKWYEWTRDLYYKDPYCSNAMSLRFEDLIYKYEDTVKKIEDFFELDSLQHTKKREFFNPEVSMNNTQLWKVYKGYDDDLKYIEKNLAKYCYDFPETSDICRKKGVRLF